jgi:hypothetical protein
VVATSIPLSICFSVLALHLIGQTINIMTLGGLALAVGIPVDDATVEIENIGDVIHLHRICADIPVERTLLLEIDVPNPNCRLYAGMYAHAKFALKNPTPALLVPDNSILIDSKGTRVLVVDPSNKIRIKPVTLGRDFGAKSQILGRLDLTDRVVQNPTEALRDGMSVSVDSAKH